MKQTTNLGDVAHQLACQTLRDIGWVLGKVGVTMTLASQLLEDLTQASEDARANEAFMKEIESQHQAFREEVEAAGREARRQARIEELPSLLPPGRDRIIYKGGWPPSRDIDDSCLGE